MMVGQGLGLRATYPQTKMDAHLDRLSRKCAFVLVFGSFRASLREGGREGGFQCGW